MPPRASKPSNPRSRTVNQSPYIQSNILSDNDVAALAEAFRISRPGLRSQSSLLKSLPFNYSALTEEPSLLEWLQRNVPVASSSGDFLFVCLLLHIVGYVDDLWYQRNLRNTWTGGRDTVFIKTLQKEGIDVRIRRLG